MEHKVFEVFLAPSTCSFPSAFQKGLRRLNKGGWGIKETLTKWIGWKKDASYKEHMNRGWGMKNGEQIEESE